MHVGYYCHNLQRSKGARDFIRRHKTSIPLSLFEDLLVLLGKLILLFIVISVM